MSESKSIFSELLKKTFVIPDDALVALDDDTFIEFGRMKDLVRMALNFGRLTAPTPEVKIRVKNTETP